MLLHRFFSLEDEKHFQWFEKLIHTNRLHLSLPKYFNDPFDCGIAVVGEISPERYRRMFRRNIRDMKRRGLPKEAFEGYDRQNREQEDRNFEAWKSPRYVKMMREAVRVSNRVVCFSDLKNVSVESEMLLWAHYADAHRGICIGFDTSKINVGRGGKFGRVKYCNKMPGIPIDEIGSRKGDEKMLFTKSMAWKYEKEWRYVEVASGHFPDFVSFFPEAIVEVTFGCETTTEHIRNVMKCVSQRSTAVALKKMELSIRSFSFETLNLGSLGARTNTLSGEWRTLWL